MDCGGMNLNRNDGAAPATLPRRITGPRLGLHPQVPGSGTLLERGWLVDTKKAMGYHPWLRRSHHVATAEGAMVWAKEVGLYKPE